MQKTPYFTRRGETAPANDQELNATLERIQRFQAQVAHLRKVETNPMNYYRGN
jgi:hypothetical protein